MRKSEKPTYRKKFPIKRVKEGGCLMRYARPYGTRMRDVVWSLKSAYLTFYIIPNTKTGYGA